MAHPPQPTKAELEVLRVLWRSGPASVKDVHATLQTTRAELGYAAVLRLMQVMHGKGLLSRDESSRSHVYAPLVAEEPTRSSLLGDFIQRAFAGSGKAMVMAALREGHVSDAERAEIAALLKREGLL